MCLNGLNEGLSQTHLPLTQIPGKKMYLLTNQMWSDTEVDPYDLDASINERSKSDDTNFDLIWFMKFMVRDQAPEPWAIQHNTD